MKKGLRRSGRRLGGREVRLWRQALMKKGLRPSPAVRMRSRSWLWRQALMKKGLRLRPACHSPFPGALETSPDEEGIRYLSDDDVLDR